MKHFINISIMALALVIGSGATCGAATVDEVMLYNKPDRQKILLEGAKKEGKITWYTSLIIDQVVRPVKEAFEKKYPFIQIEPFRGNSERIVQKMFAEYQGKRYEVDIMDGTVTAPMVKKGGYLQRFYSPHLGEYPAELKDPQGYWGVSNVYYFALGYNTRMVKPSEVPKEGTNDVVDQPRFGRANDDRQYFSIHGAGSRQSLSAKIESAKCRQVHRQQSATIGSRDRR
jgi:ABC-type glycerol-3-phosphate transport system substrate-binding protein